MMLNTTLFYEDGSKLASGRRFGIYGVIRPNCKIAVGDLLERDYIDKRVLILTVSKSAIAALSSWEMTSALEGDFLVALSHLREVKTAKNYSGRQFILGPKATR